jgi:uncharacterized protein YlzI (FlbEa/FlbD family)
LFKRIAKERAEFTKACWHLGNQIFSCRHDAEKSAISLNKKYRYHLAHYRIEAIEKYECRGRPNRILSISQGKRYIVPMTATHQAMEMKVIQVFQKIHLTRFFRK